MLRSAPQKRSLLAVVGTLVLRLKILEEVFNRRMGHQGDSSLVSFRASMWAMNLASHCGRVSFQKVV